jgi:1-deoxy-D-xylulose-5-phosphate synthase
MCLGTGLKKFREEIPERFYDVGITEQHAVTMAAALALEGYIPICAIYSTFLQRAYDQIIHDVCLQKAPVIFAVDRAGLVGSDGPTHHGPFDLSYFRCIPNIIISAPKDGEEFLALLKTAIDYRQGPFVIRYPRGVCSEMAHSNPEKLPIGKWEILQQGSDIAIMAIGSMVHEAETALVQLKEKKLQPMLINARFVKPLDTNMLHDIIRKVKKIVTVEENTLCGGFGSAVMEFYEAIDKSVEIHRLGLPDEFIEHGSRQILLKITGLDAHGIAKKIISLV